MADDDLPPSWVTGTLDWFDAYERTVESPDGRHPVIRHGDREPIPTIVRKLIYDRDGRRCKWCGGNRNTGVGKGGLHA